MEQVEQGPAGERKEKPLLHLYDESVAVDPVRSRTMSRIRSKNTKPEVALRRALWATGRRYRVHDKSLPGTPDISNKGRKVAIFVDGCFWHGCPRHFKAPKTRREFWEEKIRRNRKKRAHVLGAFEPEWHILQVYECEIREEFDAVMAAVGNAFT
jgi:DNA mismatch endonuclease, patch repair protein